MLVVRYLRTALVLLSIALCTSVSPASAQFSPENAFGLGRRVLEHILNEQQRQQQLQRQGQPAYQERPAPSVDPKVIEANKSIQQALNALGYDAGPPDGDLGARSRSAIEAFQRDRGLPPNGVLTNRQLKVLFAATHNPAAAAKTTVAGTGPAPEADQTADGPRDLPIGPEEAMWASGTWRGSFLCWRRTYNATLVLPPKAPGAVAKLEYSWRDQNGAAGRGLVELDASRNRLEALRVLSGDKDHPFGDIKIRTDENNQPIFSPAPCRAVVAMSRDPATAPKRIAAQSKEPTSPGAQSGIMGRWTGELTCRNDNHKIALHIANVQEIARAGSPDADRELLRADRPRRVAAEIQLFTSGNGSGATIVTRLIGEFVPSEKSYRFVEVSSTGRYRSVLLIRELALALSDDGSTIKGTIPNASCSTFTATELDPLASPTRPLVRAPSGGGSFYRARDVGAKCDALLAWSAPAEADYGQDAARNRHVDVSGLFVDTEFVPVFGVVFDTPRESTLGADLYTALADCRKDLLTRPKMEFLQSTVRNLFSGAGFDQESRAYVAANVAEARAAIHRLAAARSNAEKIPDLAEATIQLAKVREQFDGAKIAMLPSRKAAIDEDLRRQLSTNAARYVSKQFEANSGSSDWDQLKLVDQLRPLSGPVTVHLRPQDRAAATSRLEAIERTTGDHIFNEKITAARAVTADLSGVTAIEELRFNDFLKLLSQDARARYEPIWKENKQAKLAAAIAADLDDALVAPRNKDGLQQGANWLARFAARWKAYRAETPYRDALSKFTADRKARLAALVLEFRAELAATNGGARARLRSEYLALPEDQRSPVSLEYDFAEAGL